jgi:hypothetical protein
MNQLEQDILYLYDIESRPTNASDQLIGVNDITELDVEKRAAIYRSKQRVRALMESLKHLQKTLNRIERDG